MAKLKTDNLTQSGDRPTKRWEKIMALPENTVFRDLSTGKTYRRGMFKPLFVDGYNTVVNEFQIVGTQERVYVPFLRTINDGMNSKVGGMTR